MYYLDLNVKTCSCWFQVSKASIVPNYFHKTWWWRKWMILTMGRKYITANYCHKVRVYACVLHDYKLIHVTYSCMMCFNANKRTEIENLGGSLVAKRRAESISTLHWKYLSFYFPRKRRLVLWILNVYIYVAQLCVILFQVHKYFWPVPCTMLIHKYIDCIVLYKMYMYWYACTVQLLLNFLILPFFFSKERYAIVHFIYIGPKSYLMNFWKKYF